MASPHVLPRPSFKDPELQAWALRMADVVQRALDDLSTPPRVAVVLSNVTPTTTFDPTTATLAQTAQTLATVLQAFQRAGRVS